jgi:hypothetical protein
MRRVRVLAARIVRLAMKLRYLQQSYGPPRVGPCIGIAIVYGGATDRLAFVLERMGLARFKLLRLYGACDAFTSKLRIGSGEEIEGLIMNREG